MTAIDIVEVGPRDGLQNEKAVISAPKKAALIARLAGAGLGHIEVGSFVNPERVPQMAATAEVLSALGPMLPATQGPVPLRAMALVPNARRLAAFLEAREGDAPYLSEVAVFVSATEAFSQANLNCSVAESLSRVEAIFAAMPPGLAVRGYISCVTDCPYEGRVAPAAVARLASELKSLGCDTLALADTIGKGTPARVADVLSAVLAHWPAGRLAGHFHDTSRTALANVDVALEAGLRAFDSSVAGLGGCPYAPGATGNLATEALVAHLEARGFTTGVNTDALEETAAFARHIIGGAQGA
ncbi:MAG: hydroxymethylglutaryl-CoA lyase [Pseudomonadota bacterium]